MKTSVFMPVISLFFLLTSFNQPSTIRVNTKPVAVTTDPGLFGVDDCTLSVIISLEHNGQEMSSAFIRHRFLFCPDKTFTVTSDEYKVLGHWQLDTEMSSVTISLNSPDKMLDWLNATWRIIEHAENVLELERNDGDHWHVRFERMQR